MSNTNMLVMRFLTQLVWMKWVRATSVFMIDHCFRPSNSHEWIKLLEIHKNCNLLLITFSNSLSIVLSKMMGQ